MGNGILCVSPEKKYKNIQKQYSMIDLLIGLRPNNKLYELNALLNITVMKLKLIMDIKNIREMGYV